MKVIKIVKSWVRTLTFNIYAFFQTSPRLRRFSENIPFPIKLIAWHVYAFVLIWFIIDAGRVYRNLTLIIPGKPFKIILFKWIKTYYNIYIGMIETYVLHIHNYNKSMSIFLRRLKVSGIEHLQNATLEKGCAVLSPIQFTNIIYISAILSEKGILNHLLVPSQTWEIVDRERTYNSNYLGGKTQLIKITNTATTLLKLLRKSDGTVILMPIDSNEGVKTHDITLNIFGKNFNGGVGAIVMGVKYDIPVLLCKLVRVGYFKYHLIISPPYRFEKDNFNGREIISQACKAFYQQVETEIRKHLEQWMPLYATEI